MNPGNHLSDLQLQEYLDSNSTILEYSSHANQCAQCRIRLKNYATITVALKKDVVIPPLQINLAAAVADQVFIEKKSSRFVLEPVLYGLIFVVLAGLFVFAFPLFRNVQFIQIALLALPIVLFVSLSIKESMVLMKKLKDASYS